MRLKLQREHKMDSLFTVILFGVYMFFLMLLLVFSVRVYQASLSGLEYNRGLGTSSAYVTQKVHQHQTANGIWLDEIEGHPALCLLDTIEGDRFITYIYLEDGHLKELFTREGSAAAAMMGSVIADLEKFECSLSEDHWLRIKMADKKGRQTEFGLYLAC